ncbi:MAG TPA: hypothetical protein VF533_25790 [Solirubrobacteraceae bacterium]|jgi:hypothetical protein
MRARAIHRGDIVLVNKKGRLFHAKVQGLGATGGFAVVPIERNISYRQVAAREIVDHWAHAAPERATDPEAGGQIAFW